MRLTFEEKLVIEPMLQSFLERIGQHKEKGYSPIMIVFWSPEDPNHLIVETPGDFNPQNLVRMLYRKVG